MMDEDTKKVLRWAHYARFGAMEPKDMPRKTLDRILRWLEKNNYIYYTRVDGKKCHRLLTALGAQKLDEIGRHGE
jgi:hypothetical protein